MFQLFLLAFCLLVAASIVFFVITLVRYISAKRDARQITSPYIQEELASCRALLIVSSVIMGLFLAVIIIFTVMLFFAVAFM